MVGRCLDEKLLHVAGWVQREIPDSTTCSVLGGCRHLVVAAYDTTAISSATRMGVEDNARRKNKS